MFRQPMRLLALSFFTALLAACGGGGGSGAPNGGAQPAAQTGTVTLTVSDGIIQDYDQILMEIAEIRFLSDGGQDILVLDDPVTVDFLALQNFSEVLLQREVVTGTYNKIRLILNRLELVRLDDQGNVVDVDDVRLNGLRKVDINPRGPFQVRGGQELVIDVEIDLDKSIHVVKAGNSGQIRFRPVIFASISSQPAFDKLFRAEGTIEAIDALDGEVRLCDIRRAFTDGVNRPEPADVCIFVVTDDSTTYFDQQANPDSAGFDGLAPGDRVVAYGKFDEFATGDYLRAAVLASGSAFEDAKGIAASEYRPLTEDFDLGAANDTCTIDPDPLRVVVADGAPAFVETATGADRVPGDNLSGLSIQCLRAEVEGYFDESAPADPFLRTFIVLLGESVEGRIEVVGTLTDRAATPATNDYDFDVSASDVVEVVETTSATRIVKITSGSGGDVIEDLAAVPTGTEVTVFGIRRDADGVIEASFILQEATAP